MENVNTNINIMNMYQQKNPDIFSDINMIDPNEQYQKKRLWLNPKQRR